MEPFLDLSLPINIEPEESSRLASVAQLPSRIILKATQKKISKKISSKSEANIEKYENKSQKEDFYAISNDEDEVMSKHQTKKQVKLAQKKAKVKLIFN